MSAVTRNNVKYTIKNNYYIVGDDTKTEGNGVEDKSYSGTIVIPSNINGIEIKEISKYSFYKCQYISEVFINARITKIGSCAFLLCMRLEYINIPSSVLSIESASFEINNGYAKSLQLPATIEFEAGRKNAIQIEGRGFSFRETFQIIYPSVNPPTYTSSSAFEGVTNAYICAPKVFTFGNKQTTTDMSKCPKPLFNQKVIPTINPTIGEMMILLSNIMIIILSQSPLQQSTKTFIFIKR